VNSGNFDWVILPLIDGRIEFLCFMNGKMARDRLVRKTVDRDVSTSVGNTNLGYSPDSSASGMPPLRPTQEHVSVNQFNATEVSAFLNRSKD